MNLSISSILGGRIARVRMPALVAAIGAGLTFAAGTGAQAGAATVLVSSPEEDGIVRPQVVGLVAPTKGWQAPFDYTVPVGKNVLFSYQCPAGTPVPISGSFNANTAAQKGIILAGNYRRDDMTDNWAWAINWPTGAPAGSHIIFNVYCLRK